MSFILIWHQVKASEDPVLLRGETDLGELLKDRDDVNAASPLQVELSAYEIQGVIHVEGTAETVLSCICSRCLTSFQKDFSVSIHEKFTQDQEIVETDETENTHLISSDRIDLLPFIQENVLLEIPFIPLCNESCEGLCPVCGQNRNEHSCACKTENIDPRLAGLKDFFK